MKLPGIPREPTLPPDQDYERLRREGLSRIEALGSSRWTDYNPHDPGITLLEALCFSITDLGYRCAFPMKDLLALPPGRPAPPEGEGPLFSARSILTCAPVTAQDYRKLLLDVEGVRNAWLSPSPAPCEPLYPDRWRSRLDHQPPEEELDVAPVLPRGIYSVVLELADDPLLGSLNDTTWAWQLDPQRIPEPPLSLELVFPAWDHWRPRLRWDDPWLEEAEATVLEAKVLGVGDAEDARDTLRVEVQVEVPAGGGSTVSQTVPLLVRLRSSGQESLENDARRRFIVDELTRRHRDNPLNAYRRRVRQAFSIVSRALRALHAHRALCEDFLEPTAARFEEISLCAELEVSPEADLEGIQAQALLAVARLLAPPVRFHTLAELLARGVPVERIFDGPALEHGFLLDEDLAASEPCQEVHSSDVLSAMMGVDGVVAVRSLSLTAYGPDGRKVSADERWKIRLLDGHLPRLSPDRCRFLFYKRDIPYAPDEEEVRQKLEFFSDKEGMRQLTRPTGLPLDLEPPEGRWLALDDYRLVQDDLPRTYGVGQEGLPESAPPRRKAQARQLRAFLLLFDQLLANALSQLAHVRELFSLDPGLMRTFFSRPLCAHEGLAELFQEASVPAKDAPAPSRDDLAESEETFRERRSLFLDHLLARFNEQPSEYPSLREIDGKIAFLKDYPRLSSGRGQGFDTQDAARAWGCDNVSGLERRLCHLLGIRRCERRSLAEDPGDSEGMHLLEHVLLRPVSKECAPLGVTLQPDCEPCPESTDPYSFRATLLFPAWPRRFGDPFFRAFAEHTARLEAPAHVFLKICWVDIDHMRRFEAAFLAWLAERARPSPDPAAISRHQRALVEVLQSLRSVYPEATLHDYREDRVENPLLLGRTQLGTMPDDSEGR